MWSSTLLDESGRPCFSALQNYSSGAATLVYYAFDVMVLEGRDVMAEPLTTRRALLQSRVLARLDDLCVANSGQPFSTYCATGCR